MKTKGGEKMAIIPWRPWLEPFEEADRMLERFWEEFAPFRKELSRTFIPPLDIYQTKDKVVVETALPGIDPDKVNITIKNDVLTIEGKTEKKTEVEDKDYYRKEVRWGHFHRSVDLPVSVDETKAKATYEDGVLKIEIPKAKQEKAKSIKVQAVKKKKK